MKSVIKRLKLLFLAVMSGLIVLVMSAWAAGSLPALGQTPAVNQPAAATAVETVAAKESESPTEAEPTPESTEAEAGEPTEADSTESDSAAKPEAQPPVSEAVRIRRKLLIQGDRAYLAGNMAEAEALYSPQNIPPLHRATFCTPIRCDQPVA